LRRTKRASIAFADNAGTFAAAQRVESKRAVSPAPPSASKDRQEQTQYDTNDEARNDWKIKRAVFTFDPNVTWQASEPFRRQSTPQNEPEYGHNHTDDHQKFTDVVHD